MTELRQWRSTWTFSALLEPYVANLMLSWRKEKTRSPPPAASTERPSRGASADGRRCCSSTERLLGVAAHTLPLENPGSSTTTDELDEDDVVFVNDDNTEPKHNNNHPSSTPSSFSSTPVHHNHKSFGFSPPDSFGILAALPESDAPLNTQTGSYFFRKASVSVSVSVSLSSSSSSSSSRLIPSIPKPPPHDLISSSVKYHQSTPVNVPIFSPGIMNAVRRPGEFDEDHGNDDYDAEDEEMVPLHEIVDRNAARSPMLSCSVLEGVGRTLKGRDLRQVRNAVFRQTGFLD